MLEQAVLFAVYAGIPAIFAAIAGALITNWRGAILIAAVSIALLFLMPRTVPALGLLVAACAGAGIAALFLVPVLALRPATSRPTRAAIGATVVAGAGSYLVFSNPGIV